MGTPINREQRRRAARRRVGGLAGMSLVATTGLFGAYLGNPRVPRAYAVPPILSCLVDVSTDTNAAGGGVGTYDAVAQTGRGDFRFCLTSTSDGGTISFDPATDGVDILLEGNLGVRSSTVTIAGNGQNQTVIDGEGYYGLAVAGYYNEERAPSNPVVSLSDLTLTDFTSHDNDEFVNGYSGTTRGGALWAYYADAVITDVTFTDNLSDGYGGAVAMTGGTLQVTGSTFTGNEAAYGGAIYQHYSSTSMTITDSTFSGNTASVSGYGYGWGGGALLALGDATITGSTFTDNYADGNGGAVVSSGYGQASQPTLTISDSTFSRNTSDRTSRDYGGGAIFATGAVTVSGSTFTDNYARNYGGAIYSSGADSSLVITESTFSDNEGLDGGGAIYAYGALSIDYSAFTANNADSGDGGAINAGDYAATIQRSTFSGNAADSSGGAVRSAGGYLTSITNSTFTSNVAGSGGGAVYLDNGGFINFSTISANTAAYDGGGVYAASGRLDVANSIVTDNSTDDVYAASFYPSYSIFTSEGSISTPSGSSTGVLFGDPLLGSLADNGGPTLTMLPDPGSPVVGMASIVEAPATDQRGWARTTGGQADMGAVESRAVRPAPDLSQVPPSWYQATKRNAPDAPCPDGLDPSWAEWPNDGTGGWTCEFTTWWDVNKGTKGGWVTTPGFRSTDKGRAVHHFRFRAAHRDRSAAG